MTGGERVFTGRGCREVARLVGKVYDLRKMMGSMTMMDTRPGVNPLSTIPNPNPIPVDFLIPYPNPIPVNLAMIPNPIPIPVIFPSAIPNPIPISSY